MTDGHEGPVLVDVIVLDQYVGLTNTDAHGIGEPSNVATAAAVAKAVYNAIGVRIRELPMTPRTVLAARSRASSSRPRPVIRTPTRPCARAPAVATGAMTLSD
ncbi:MAG: 4-hydroxybenzoyl-CoA reductase subunit alpha [Myxococcales bacterium]|nr:4-hydroxybenzoyl-CoA reductase subunit alpha [Myxococcales bacterium]